MKDCPAMESCPFYNNKMSNMPQMPSVYKLKYCRSHYESCARYNIAHKYGMDRVPKDLLPNRQQATPKQQGSPDTIIDG